MAHGAARTAAEAAAIDVLPALPEALDALRVAVTLFDSNERLIYCNRHFNQFFPALPPRRSLYGLSYAELIRLKLEHGAFAQPGEDTESSAARRRAHLQGGDFQPRDFALSDGRTLEMKTRRTSAGGWIALWTDVTEARRTAMQREDLAALAAEAFAVWDTNDRLLFCNAAYAAIHGQILNASFEEHIRSAAKDRRFAMDDAEEWIARRLHAHRKPASPFTLVTTSGEAYRVRDGTTREGGRATVLTDITAQRRAEIALDEQARALQRAKRALEKAQEQAKKQQRELDDLTRRLDEVEAVSGTAKAALLRLMGHELKSPLNAIIGFADLMQGSAERFSTEQITEYAGLIGRAGKSLLRLINQILDLTRISAHRFPLQLTNIPVGGVLWLAVDNARGKAEEKQIAVDLGDCVSDVAVRADEGALRHIVGELIDNAITFAGEGSEVMVSVACEGGVVRIGVADNGPGVAPEDLGRVLEPFGHARGDRTQGGAGLGLPLAKALAEIQGGALSVASTFGEGFTATLELPEA
jgi:signal transduction histidine kinase